MEKGKIYSINEYYNFRIETCDLERHYFSGYVINLTKNTEKRITVNEDPIFLLCNNITPEEMKNFSKEKREELVKEGKIIKTSAYEIWKNIVGIDEDLLILAKYNCDKRSKQYLDTCLKNVGFIERKDGWECDKFEILKEYKSFFYDIDIEVGKIEEGKYVAQFGYRTDIDDYNITRLYFNHLPTKNDISTTLLVYDIYQYFFMNEKHDPYIINCWECGRKVHWLDIEGTLKEKYEAIEEQYCGC